MGSCSSPPWASKVKSCMSRDLRRRKIHRLTWRAGSSSDELEPQIEGDMYEKEARARDDHAP